MKQFDTQTQPSVVIKAANKLGHVVVVSFVLCTPHIKLSSSPRTMFSVSGLTLKLRMHLNAVMV